DRVRDVGGGDTLLLNELRPKVTALLQTIGPHHGQRDVMPHSGLRFGGEEIARRRVKEFHNGRVFPGRRVRDVDNDVSTGHRFSQPFTGYGVDAGLGRCRHDLMAALSQLLAEPRSDESTATNNYDLHVGSPCLSPRIGAIVMMKPYS